MAGTFREESRKNFTREAGATSDDLRLGCLQRIADATELMAKRHSDLIAAKERAESSRDYWRQRAESLERSVTAYRGQLTRAKRKPAADTTTATAT